MKARNALTGLALVLGMALPAAAEPPDGIQLAQAPTDATRPAPGPGARPHWGQRPEGPDEVDSAAGREPGSRRSWWPPPTISFASPSFSSPPEAAEYGASAEMPLRRGLTAAPLTF